MSQRKCACGQHTMAGDQCAECKKNKTLRRQSAGSSALALAPPIVHEVLLSPGQPLDADTRAFFEPLFGRHRSMTNVRNSPQRRRGPGLTVASANDEAEREAESVEHGLGNGVAMRWNSEDAPSPAIPDLSRMDFSLVRVHADSRAGESADAISAVAYTAGEHVVFGAGRYAPGTPEGKRLIAHELTHVVQQGGSETGAVHRKLGTITKSGCSITLGMDIGIYGSRSNAALATQWQNWINTLWKGTAACHGNSTGVCDARVSAKVTAHPAVNWWWGVSEANSAFVQTPGYRSRTNRAIDGGDWAVDEDDRSIAHETGHLMGQGDKYWNIPFTKHPSQSAFVNDIMANYYRDPGPTEYGPALSRILEDHSIECPCCLKYPPCGANNCALNPGLPCEAVGERRHCEWIRANNTPEALANYHTDCSTLMH
jgi:hypothetical protein